MARKASKNLAVPVGPEPSGFSAQIQGASLWDLVQMECLGRSRGAVRVQSASGQTGLLFFEAGRIAHAQTARAVGELAALEILAWESGTFDPCDAVWPRVLTITTSSEGLLLRAAKSRDDSSASNLVAFPGRGGGAAPPVVDIAAETASPEEIEGLLLVDDQEWEMEVTRPSGPSFTPPPGSGAGTARRGTSEEIVLPVAVHVAPDGTILEATDEDLADAVAYAGRLSSLIGELLGLDGFRALECASKDERVIIYTGQDGGLVAGRIPIDVEVGALRDRLGL